MFSEYRKIVGLAGETHDANVDVSVHEMRLPLLWLRKKTGCIVLAVIVCYDGEKSKRGCFMEINKKTLRRILLIILFAVVLIWAGFVPAQSGAVLSKVGGILSPFVIGGALAFIINVPMRAIESRLFQKRTRLQKLRRPIALVLALLFVLLVVAFVIMAVVPELVRTIYLIAESVPAYLTELSEKIVDWANRTFNETPELLDWINSIQINWGGLAEKLLGFVQSGVTDVVGSTVGFAVSLFGGIANFFVSLIFAIYVLFSKEILCRQCKMLLYGWLSEARADRVVEIAVLSRKAFANFITGQCLEACILGAMFALSMWIFRPHPDLRRIYRLHRRRVSDFGAKPDAGGLVCRDVPRHSADRGQRDLSEGGRQIGRSARDLGADCLHRRGLCVWSDGHGGDDTHLLGGLHRCRNQCVQANSGARYQAGQAVNAQHRKGAPAETAARR